LAFLILVAGWLIFGVVRRVQVERVGALTALLAAGLAFGTNQVISHFWARPRPFTSHPGVHVLLAHPADASFPSDHVAAAIAISMVLLSIHRRLGIVAVGMSLLVGYARVYAGDHYPGDVLGGVVVGGLAAAVVGALRVPELLARRL
jgi:undecaprenyl-diphosphatase